MHVRRRGPVRRQSAGARRAGVLRAVEVRGAGFGAADPGAAAGSPASIDTETSCSWTECPLVRRIAEHRGRRAGRPGVAPLVVGLYAVLRRLPGMRVLIVEDEPTWPKPSVTVSGWKRSPPTSAGDGTLRPGTAQHQLLRSRGPRPCIPAPPATRSPRIVASGSGIPILMLTAADPSTTRPPGSSSAPTTTSPTVRVPGSSSCGCGRWTAGARTPGPRSARSRACGWTPSAGRSSQRRYVALNRKQFAELEVLLAAEGGVVSAETLGSGLGRQRRPLHQRRPHHRLRPAQTTRRPIADRHGARCRIPTSTPAGHRSARAALMNMTPTAR